MNNQLYFDVYRFDVRDGGTLVLASAGVTKKPTFDDFQYNGTAVFIDRGANEIQLTPKQGSANGSAFWKTKVNPALPWRATFHFRTINPDADGFTFIMQNDPRGLEALGGTGGTLGVGYQEANDTVYQAITPSYGCAYDLWRNQLGWVSNGVVGNNVGTPNGINIRDGIDVVVEYNGMGVIRQTITQGENVAILERAVDLSALGASAWVGFTGACGGLTTDQRVSNFTFEQTSYDDSFDMSASDWVWQRNDAQGTGSGYEDYTIGEGDDAVTVPAIRITSGGGQIVSVTYRRVLDPEVPFVLKGTYVRGDDPAANNNPADGGAFVFHSDGLYTTGGGGSNRGVQTSADGVGSFETAYGWAFQTWGNQNLFPVEDAKLGAAVNIGNDAGIRFDSGNPIDFTIRYENNVMTITLVQIVDGEEKTYTESRKVNLVEKLGSDRMYFSLTGSTGAYWIKQLVYDLSFEPLAETKILTETGVGHVRASGGAAIVVGGGAETAGIAHLTLVGNAAVAVRSAGDANTGYTLDVGEFLFEEDGVKSAPSLTLAANGSGTGTLRIGALTVDEVGDVLTVNAGAVAALGEGPAVVSLPAFTGAVPVLDMRGVPLQWRPKADAFTLDTPTREPNTLRINGGILYAVHNMGLLIYVK